MLSSQPARQRKMVSSPIPASRRKSGRTPEQQSARDAGRAAKVPSLPGSSEAESSAQAQQSSPERPSKKRRREAAELEVDINAPEPLSKAEARAARKKSRKGQLNENNISIEKIKDGEGTPEKIAEAKPRDKKRNSVWIGNLSFKTTSELLKDFVIRGVKELDGEAEGCVTRVNLPKQPGHGEFAGNKG